MGINLNQTLTSLSAAYHAGKLTKTEYRQQRATELERLSQYAEESSRECLSGSKNRKKHITVSAVLFGILVSIVIVVLMSA